VDRIVHWPFEALVMSRQTTMFSRLVLFGMTAGLVLYVVLHSPIRDLVSGLLLGRAAHTAYFTSLISGGRAAYGSAGAALFAILAALTAATSIADRAGCLITSGLSCLRSRRLAASPFLVPQSERSVRCCTLDCCGHQPARRWSLFRP